MSVAALKAETATAPVPTPCIGVCQIDERSGWCRGCGRNADEVGAWQSAGERYKQGVWDELPSRRVALGLKIWRLSWSPAEIAAMIECTLRRRWGRWVLGVEGASASLAIGQDEDAEIISTPESITAVTPRGALRLLKHEKTIALAFGDAADASGPESICLVLPRGRVKLRSGPLLICVGRDLDAIRAVDRGARLYDLGIAAELAARFCLRTDDTMLAAKLEAASGKSWRQNRRQFRTHFASAPAHTIVETGLGRCEIFAPPTVQTGGGALAVLDDRAVGSPRELPAGWEIMPVFAPCALFYPDRLRPAEAFLDGPF